MEPSSLGAAQGPLPVPLAQMKVWLQVRWYAGCRL